MSACSHIIAKRQLLKELTAVYDLHEYLCFGPYVFMLYVALGIFRIGVRRSRGAPTKRGLLGSREPYWPTRLL